MIQDIHKDDIHVREMAEEDLSDDSTEDDGTLSVTDFTLPKMKVATYEIVNGRKKMCVFKIAAEI